MVTPLQLTEEKEVFHHAARRDLRGAAAAWGTRIPRSSHGYGWWRCCRSYAGRNRR
jgi:hypothetical protein